jgi:hypothetical protein
MRYRIITREPDGARYWLDSTVVWITDPDAAIAICKAMTVSAYVADSFLSTTIFDNRSKKC